MSAIATNLQAVRQRIADAAQAAGHDPASMELLAVSKTWPASAVSTAAAAGQQGFGESYLQEALTKINELATLKLNWHFIGPIQSNKSRQIAENFAWVHSIERLKIAQHLAAQRPATLVHIGTAFFGERDQP